MNCTALDSFVSSTNESVTQSDAGFAIAVGLLLSTSLALLTHGERLVRPLVAVVGGVVGATGTFVLTRVVAVPCEARLGVAAVCGIMLALLATCVLKTGLFLLGAFGLGATAHLVWESLPLGHVVGPFSVAGRAGWYYITVGAAATTGAVVSQVEKKKFTRIASSVLGGVGVAVATRFIYDREHVSDPPPALLLAVVVSCTLFGYVAQRRVREWDRRRRGGDRDGRRAAGGVAACEVVPMGQRVR